MAQSSADARAAWVWQVLGVAIPMAAHPAPSASVAAEAGWGPARDAAVATLRALEAAIKKRAHPRADQVLVMVLGVRANLPGPPLSPQKAADLRRWLDTDEIVAALELPNVFGIQVRLREPLLAALPAA